MLPYEVNYHILPQATVSHHCMVYNYPLLAGASEGKLYRNQWRSQHRLHEANPGPSGFKGFVLNPKHENHDTRALG